ncbi:MAG TPA: STAS domain-containing protein [Anaerolineales bacterium]|nr:STAS domain-containing protein [Anaerolineales bacterium]
MAAKVESDGGIARIVLSGDFDFSSQARLAEAFDEALLLPGVNEIRVDMTDTTFVDSSFIRALVKLRENARLAQRSLSIWNCNERVREIFVIGGFDQLFMLH